MPSSQMHLTAVVVIGLSFVCRQLTSFLNDRSSLTLQFVGVSTTEPQEKK